MSLLEFNYNKTLIYVAIYWIIEIVARLVRKLNKPYFQMVDDQVQYEYILVIYATIGDLLSGFLVLYTRHTSKSQREKSEQRIIDENNNIKSISLIYEGAQPAVKKNLTRYLIIISVLEYIFRCNYCIAFAITEIPYDKISSSLRGDLLNAVNILTRYIFSIIFLKIKIYKHHKVSIFIILMGISFVIIADVISCIYLGNDVPTILYFSSLILVQNIGTPYEHFLIRKLFQENFIHPAKMQFVRAIINSILVIVFGIIFFFSFNLEFQSKFEFPYIITGIGFIIVDFIREFITLKVIYHMSPQSVSFIIISKSVSNGIYGIINVKEKDFDENGDDIAFIILEILGFLIILFATLVYDEIIIINKCNLDYYTKKRIAGRGEMEKEDVENLEDLPIEPTFTQDDIIDEIKP